MESLKREVLKLYQSSAGLGLTATVKHHAARLCNLHYEEIEIEGNLFQLTSQPEFEPYRQVFTLFQFGDRVSAMILSQIYPFENYLTAEGKPHVIHRRSRQTGKYTKRYLSRRRFEKALDVAPTEDSSGDRESKKIIGGSDKKI